MLSFVSETFNKYFNIGSSIPFLLSSWICGMAFFIITYFLVHLTKKGGELRRIQRILTILRVLICFLLIAQLPLFYLAVSFESPVEKNILFYGKERRSWLFYLGRPCISTMGLLFGFFSDISVFFRNSCLIILLSLLIQDSLSSMLMADRLECLESGTCNQRSVWNAELYLIFIFRDLFELTMVTWSICLEGYLMIYIGLWPPYYYDFRQLSIGEMNPMHRIKKDYKKFHNEYTYYDEEDGLCISNVSLQMTKSKKIYPKVGKKRGKDT